MFERFSLGMLSSMGVTLVGAVSVLNNVAGTDFDSACVESVWQNLLVLGGGISAWIGRYRVGDVKPFGARKG